MTDTILTFNAGSSTIKLGFYALEIAGPRPLATGVIDFRDEPFAVLLGDDLIDEKEDLLSEMIEVQQRTGGSVVALLEVPQESIGAYGCADVSAVEGEDFVRVNGLVEKPEPAEAPSNLAVIGRYVLHQGVFEVLEHTEPGRGHEIQLPSLRLALIQLVLGAANWSLMALVVYYMLSQQADYPEVLGILMISSIAGVVAHIPAGLGVIEAVFVAMLADEMSKGAIVGGLIGYRVIYFLIPLLFATLVYVVLEARAKKLRSSNQAGDQEPVSQETG